MSNYTRSLTELRLVLNKLKQNSVVIYLFYVNLLNKYQKRKKNVSLDEKKNQIMIDWLVFNISYIMAWTNCINNYYINYYIIYTVNMKF